MDVNARITVPRVVTALILVVVVVAGPPGVVDIVATDDERLGDGTASVTVLEPETNHLRVTDGRFGAAVSYVRLPDLVVDVDRVEGQPRIQYTIAVPELGVEKAVTRVVTSERRVHLSVADQALPGKPERAEYRGFLRVRVQSFTTEKTVVNRSLEVAVE